MSRLSELLNILNIGDENARIEAKKGTKLGKSCLPTISAFSNEPGGGFILLGVSASGEGVLRRYEAHGVDEPDQSWCLCPKHRLTTSPYL